MRSMFKLTVMIIIGLVFLILIIGYIRYINTQMDEAAKIKQCQGSIEAYISIRTLSAKLEAPDINCPTEYTTITSKDKEVIKKEVVDSIARCWRMWKKGEYSFLSSGSDMFCHLCEVIDFKEKGIKISKPEMNDYCKKRMMGEETLAAYFAPVYHPSDIVEQATGQDKWLEFVCQEVDTNKQYVIIYNEIHELVENGETTTVIVTDRPDYAVRNFFKENTRYEPHKYATEVSIIYPSFTEYAADELKYCQMTLAEQKT